MELTDAGPLVFAPFVGSAPGSLVWRLPARFGILSMPSQCDRCATELEPHDLLSLISFLLLKGRRRHCRTAIASYHRPIEIAATVVPT